jgi:hypothetical protein
MLLLVREPRHRPVEPDAHVRVLGLLCAVERVLHDPLRAREVAGVAERVAEERRVPHRRGGVGARRFGLRQTALEQLDRLVGAAGAGVGAAELGVDVEAVDRHERLVREGGLEQGYRVTERAGLERERRERDARPQGARAVAGGEGLVDELAQPLLDALGLAEADGQLEVGEPELATLGRIEHGAGLEVLRRHAELGAEAAERLDGRLPRPRLDAGDIGVRDAGRGQLALREPLLQPKPLQALPDRLGRAPTRPSAHPVRILIGCH